MPGYKAGDCCAECGCGKYYLSEEQKQLEITGSPVLQVTRHRKKVLRCNACGDCKKNLRNIKKWTNEARSSIVIHKVFGMPWHRLSRLQNLCGVPIAVSTIWHQAEALWQEVGQHVVQILYDLAAESPTIDTDDTSMRIIDVNKEQKLLPEKERRACHTTAMCAEHNGFKINLYVTSLQYCQQNWTKLLEQRQSDVKPVIMTDASSQSLPKKEQLDKVESAVCLLTSENYLKKTNKNKRLCVKVSLPRETVGLITNRFCHIKVTS